MSNKIKIRKVQLGTFIDILADLYDSGVDYIDIIGTLDDKQDSIGISFCKEYMAEDHIDNFDNISVEFTKEEDNDVKIDINIKFSDDDINQLL